MTVTTPRRGKPLGTNIYPDRYGITVRVGPRGPGHEHRFRRLGEFDDTLGGVVTVARLEAWRKRREADLLETGPAPTVRGTLRADVPVALAQIPAGINHDAIATRLRLHWLSGARAPNGRGVGANWGDRHRAEITAAMIRTQRVAWVDAGVASSTVDKRVSALRTVLRLLASSEDERLPTDKIKSLGGPAPEKRGIPLQLVQFILDQIEDRGAPPRRRAGGPRLCAACGVHAVKNYRFDRCGACRRTRTGEARPRATPHVVVRARPPRSENLVRLRLMTWAGIPQVGIERLRPEHWNRAAHELTLVPRRKGRQRKGVTPQPTVLPLIPYADAALHDYDRLQLWGKWFDRRALNRMWQRAIVRAIARAAEIARTTGDSTILDLLVLHIPPHCRAYDLRHSFLSEVALEGGERVSNAVGQHALHSTQTRRYTMASVDQRVARAIEQLADRLATTPRLGAGAPAVTKGPRVVRLARAK